MRTIVLIDGQNLFHLAKEAWGYSWPNYDVQKLAQALTALKSGRVLEEVRFYTGMPTEQSNPRWYGFWNNKLRRLGAPGNPCLPGPDKLWSRERRGRQPSP